MDQEQDRAARLRENKRRHRQRQRDHVSSLQARLDKLEARGVQATQEVQASARKVVADNARLKTLLRHLGVDEHVIETWKEPCAASEAKVSGTRCQKISKPCRKETCTAVASSLETSPVTPPAVQLPQHQNKCKQGDETGPSVTNYATNESSQPTDSTAAVPSALKLPPCKVLSRLAEDPLADVTQPCAAPADAIAEHHSGQVECSTAHSLLMTFATTDEKLQALSRTLESGCRKNGRGGCSVPSEHLWKTIDELT